MASGPISVYRIHPGIGIARLGNSPSEFCVSPERPAALPTACDAQGNPCKSADGTGELEIKTFKDVEGRIKRQAARFSIHVYDERSPEGRPLQLGDPVEGGGNHGVLVDIQWRVHLANKKACWYRFQGLNGEHGYAASHPRRNADITDPNARQQLIIDPGPRVVNATDTRRASFDRGSRGVYAPTFPPPLQPHSIDTLGELLTDDSGRLLVLGGHGHSGSFKSSFGQPRIDSYANTDGWFDDTSDGPVMARLVIYSKEVERLRFIDVEGPAWVLTGYPAYVPEILDMITLDDVLFDLSIRDFAYRTDLYGKPGTFQNPEQLPPDDLSARLFWKAGALDWNAEYRPWFYRDVWPILFRADEFTYLTSILSQSNFPHDQTGRGNFDPNKLGQPPIVNRRAEREKCVEAVKRYRSGALFVEAFESALLLLDAGELTEEMRTTLRDSASTFAAQVAPPSEAGATTDPLDQLRAWQEAAAHNAESLATKAFEAVVEGILGALAAPARLRTFVGVRRLERREPEGSEARTDTGSFEDLARRQVTEFRTGELLAEAFRKARVASTHDYFGKYRTFLHDLLRRPGEENQFRLGGKPNKRTTNLPLMPLLCGDNPITNELPSKFLRLTDYQLFILKQWAAGKFINEQQEGWVKDVHPFEPYAAWVNRTARDLDRGVLANLLGGAFCPGGEVSWIIRNPAIYLSPYRLKADPDFASFRLTAAQANSKSGAITEQDFAGNFELALSQDSDFDKGLQPGDLTKYGGLPWQADFNECSTQSINITYDEWNSIDPTSANDSLMAAQEKVWETLWWPAHRPMQTFEVIDVKQGVPSTQNLAWSRGIPQTLAGDLEMVSQWSLLPFVVRNPYVSDAKLNQASPLSSGIEKYVSVERTKEKE